MKNGHNSFKNWTWEEIEVEVAELFGLNVESCSKI